MNTVCLLGRLAQEPELKQTPSGTAVLTMRLAVNRNFKNRQGGYDADFINCVAWRKTAEFIYGHFGKGDSIAVVGAIQTRNYKDKQGADRTAFEVVVDSAFFTGEKKERREPNDYYSTARFDEPEIDANAGDLPF